MHKIDHDKWENYRAGHLETEEPVVTEDIEDSKEVIVEDIKETKEVLEEKAEMMGFKKFRKWAKNNYGVTGRSVEGLIEDILNAQEEN